MYKRYDVNTPFESMKKGSMKRGIFGRAEKGRHKKRKKSLRKARRRKKTCSTLENKLVNFFKDFNSDFGYFKISKEPKIENKKKYYFLIFILNNEFENKFFGDIKKEFWKKFDNGMYKNRLFPNRVNKKGVHGKKVFYMFHVKDRN